jgi:hypothetical protein
MKKATLFLIFVVFLASCKQNTMSAEAQIVECASITDKNNPQSILYAFLKLAKFHKFAPSQFPIEIEAIIDSLSSNGQYIWYSIYFDGGADGYTLQYDENEFAIHKDKYIGKKSYTDEYGDSYSLWITKSTYQLDTAKNAIIYQSSSENADYHSPKNVYLLINSAHKPKLIMSRASFYLTTVTYQNDIGIYDLDSLTGISEDSTSMELFRVRSKDFFIESTPDSLTHFGYSFLFTCFDKGIIAQCLLDLDAYPNWGKRSSREEVEGTQWQKGNVIDFYFIDGKFTRSEPYFKENKKMKSTRAASN